MRAGLRPEASGGRTLALGRATPCGQTRLCQGPRLGDAQSITEIDAAVRVSCLHCQRILQEALRLAGLAELPGAAIQAPIAAEA